MTDLAVGPAGRRWAATPQGLWSQAEGRWVRVAEIDGRVVAVHAFASGRVVAVGPHEIWAQTPAGRWRVEWRSSGDDAYLTDLDALAEDDAWVTGSAGLVLRWDGSSWDLQPRITHRPIWGVYRDPRGGVVAFGGGPPLSLDEGYWEPLQGEAPRVQDVVRADDGVRLVVERDGAGGRRGAALMRWDGSAWVEELGLPEPFFRLVRHRDGWAGLDDDGVWVHSGGRWETVTPSDGAPALQELASTGERLIVGGSRGVHERRSGGWTPPPAVTVQSLHEVGGETEAFFAGSDVVLRWDGEALVDETPDGGPGRDARIVIDRHGAVLAVASAQTFVRETDGWRRIRHEGFTIDQVARRGRHVLGLSRRSDGSRIFRWRGDGWEETLSSPDRLIVALGPRQGIVHARGSAERGTALVQGGRRRPLEQPEGMLSRPAVYFVGDDVLFVSYRQIHHYDGARIRLLTEAPSTIHDLHGDALDALVAVSRGRVLAFDGEGWREMTLPEGARVRGIGRAGGAHWAVGSSGLLLRRADLH